MDQIPPAPPISAPPVAPLPEPKNKIWLWILGGVLLLGTGIVAGVLFGKQLYFIKTAQVDSYDQCVSAKGSRVLQTYPTICVAASGQRFIQSLTDEEKQNLIPPDLNREPTGSNPTANWKIYINTEYNYLLKYPSNLTVGENGMARGDTQKATAIVLYEDKTDKFESPRFAVTVRIDSNTLESMAKNHYQKLSTNRLSEKEKETASKNLGYTISDNQIVSPIASTTFLDAFASFQYTIRGSTIDDGASEYGVPQEEHKYIWFEANQKFFLISFTNTNLMNQILSTFKFLGTQSSDQQNANSPVVVFDPSISAVAKAELAKKVVAPYIDYHQELDSNAKIVSISLTANTLTNKDRYPYAFEAIFAATGKNDLLLSQTNGQLDWWVPEYTNCDQTPNFPKKYPESGKTFVCK